MGNVKSKILKHKTKGTKVQKESYDKKRSGKIVMVIGDKNSGKRTIMNQIISIYSNNKKSIQSTFELESFIINETAYELDYAASTYKNHSIVYKNIHKSKSKVDFNANSNISRIKYELLSSAYIHDIYGYNFPTGIIGIIDNFAAMIPNVQSILLQMDQVNFEFWNVSIDYQLKWNELYQYVHGVIFVLDLTSLYEYIKVDDETINGLTYSFNLFKSMAKSVVDVIKERGYSRTISLMLFLNKADLFRKKIEINPWTEYTDFDLRRPSFAENELDYLADKTLHYDAEYDEAIKHIQRNFKECIPDMTGFIGMDGREHIRKLSLFSHIISAVDTVNMTKVMDGCRQIVIQQNLAMSGS